MTFGQAISYNLSNLGNFNGRASRPEFWWWILAMWILQVFANLIFTVLPGDNGFLGFIGWVISIILILATIAVGARRLHDTGKSVWWQLMYLIPCVGWIIMIVLWAQAGTPGDNTYGTPSA